MAKVSNPLLSTSAIMREWDWARNTIDPETVSIRSSKKAYWRCSLNHSWVAQIVQRAVKNAGLCPYCTNRITLEGFNDFATTHPEIAHQWTGRGTSPNEVTSKSTASLEWTCSMGHVWLASARTRANGSGCRQCFLSPSREQGIEALPIRLKEELSHKNDPDFLAKVFIRSQIKLIWKGKCGHEWEAAVSSRLRGAGCRYCLNFEVLPGFNDAATTNHNLSLDCNDPRLSILGAWSDEELDWTCNLCQAKETASIARRNSRGCLSCKNPSRLEEKAFLLVRDLYDGRIERGRRPLVSTSGQRFELDLWLPDLKLAFEVQDFTTHSRDSDDEVGHPWTPDGVKHGPRYHESKRMLAMEALGITLVDIWEDDILETRARALVSEAIEAARSTL